MRVVKAVHVSQALSCTQCQRVLARLANVRAMDEDARIQVPAVLHLGDGRNGGHDDGHVQTQLLAVVGEREGVVAGARGDDAATASIGRELHAGRGAGAWGSRVVGRAGSDAGSEHACCGQEPAW